MILKHHPIGANIIMHINFIKNAYTIKNEVTLFVNILSHVSGSS